MVQYVTMWRYQFSHFCSMIPEGSSRRRELPRFEVGQQVQIAPHYTVQDGRRQETLCPATAGSSLASGSVTGVVEGLAGRIAKAECNVCEYSEMITVWLDGSVTHTRNLTPSE